MENVDPEAGIKTSLIVEGTPRSDDDGPPSIERKLRKELESTKRQLGIMKTSVLPTIAAIMFLSGVLVGALVVGNGQGGSIAAGTAEPVLAEEFDSGHDATAESSAAAQSPACTVRTSRVYSVDSDSFEVINGSLDVDNRFAVSLFNMTCLRANGTGNPCDVHVAEEFSDGVHSSPPHLASPPSA